MNNDQYDEVPKYKKQKESNISKSNKKSKHKHQYEECLIQYNFTQYNLNKLMTKLMSYCTICGKIGDKFKEDKSMVKDFSWKVDTNYGICYAVISDEELYKRYHNKMPVFFVEDIWSEYIDLEQNDK